MVNQPFPQEPPSWIKSVQVRKEALMSLQQDQALTSNRSKSDFTILSEETRFTVDSESHYQPLVKRAEQSVYDIVTVGGSKDGENKNIETVSNNSEGHYQPLMKREEPSNYQPISTCISGHGQTLTNSFVMQSESNSEEGYYQALVRKQEENTYQSLTLHRDTSVAWVYSRE